MRALIPYAGAPKQVLARSKRKPQRKLPPEQPRRDPPADMSDAIKAVLAEVAEKHDVTVDDLHGRRRRPAYARFEAAWRLRCKPFSLSYPQIGRILGWADHSTAYYAVQQYEDRNGIPAE